MNSGGPTLFALLGIILIFAVIRIALGGRGGTGRVLFGVFALLLVIGAMLSFGGPSTRARYSPAQIAIHDSTARAHNRDGRKRSSSNVSTRSNDARTPQTGARAEPPSAAAAQTPPRDWADAEAWGRMAGRLIERWSHDYVEANWTEFSPMAVSFPERIIVIGRGEIEVRRVKSKRDRERSWNKVQDRARDSAAEQLARLLRSFREKSDPGLQRIERKLRRLDSRNLQALAARLLKTHGDVRTGPKQFPEGPDRPVFSQSIRVEIDHDQFINGLLDELGVPPTAQRSDARNASARRRSRSGMGTIASLAVVCLLVFGASSVLRAGANRRPSA